MGNHPIKMIPIAAIAATPAIAAHLSAAWQSSTDHELHGRVHVDRCNRLARMTIRPDAQQFVHKALADLWLTSEIDLDRLAGYVIVGEVTKRPREAALVQDNGSSSVLWHGKRSTVL
jgi:hypothetical protein